MQYGGYFAVTPIEQTFSAFLRNDMERVLQFLKEAETFYLSTVDGDRPCIRPFGSINEFEGKLYMATSNTKTYLNRFRKILMSGSVQ